MLNELFGIYKKLADYEFEKIKNDDLIDKL
jgi:hypothetical protein